MGVSKNSGTPKSSILIGFPIIFTIHFGGFPPIFGNTYVFAPDFLQKEKPGDFQRCVPAMKVTGYQSFPPAMKRSKQKNLPLVGGWTNPFEKYARENGFIFPKVRGENKKCLSCQHPEKLHHQTFQVPKMEEPENLYKLYGYGWCKGKRIPKNSRLYASGNHSF